MKQIRKRLTYANVMSSIAVFLMLGGATAFAASKIGANQLKANSVKTGKIVKEAVKAGKLAKNAVTTPKIANGAVTTEKIANDAVTGEKANESTFGTVPSAVNAQQGAPAAYAEIEGGGGIVDTEPSRGIVDANVTSPAPGVYCVDLGFAPKTASGNAESEGSEDGIVSLQLGAPFNECPSSAEAEVRIYDAGDEEEDAGENIWVQFDS